MALLRLDQMSGEEARRQLGERRLAILPIGAIEAHGPHLPTGTDNLLALAIAERVAEEMEGVLLPLLPYGQVWSLQDFPGSLSISTETLASLLVELGLSLQRQGAAFLAIINGHVGNGPALQMAARRLYQAKGPLTYVFTYPGLSEIAIQVCSSRPLPGGYFHADEIETSMVLYVAPEAVRMDRAVREDPRLPPDFLYRPVPWSEITRTGVLGDPTLATPEKGSALIAGIVERIVAVLRFALQSGG
ncbi:Putative mycofactocin system creatinine amidohydrolase family protein MftE [Candidatus Thermoflexus japonica]|uniref:Mycofactocin system creatinine amidohydrolase family protein MftE n=1 Tax=Candidatus Thermoflexus japonica TaxID=2035417 RepID=A0A2H5Y4S1_9CHLR|nr:Putative mycofactocin system creatinine amidohydrolase family protein MftE [Candidatus Thermoflexus japonica]